MRSGNSICALPYDEEKANRAAVVALYHLYTDNEPSAEVYGAAVNRQQASIVFDVPKQSPLKKLTALLQRSWRSIAASATKTQPVYTMTEDCWCFDYKNK